MRNFKTLALITALTLSAAIAQSTSTSDGFGNAEATATASGAYASAVSFTLPTASLSIPSQQIRPGATFTITVPVTNTTDRAVNISAGDVVAPANADVEKTTASFNGVAPGATVKLIYTITFSPDTGDYSTFTGTANFSFQILAADAASTVTNLEY